VLLAVLGCAAGVVAGLFSGPLWLDEALSVSIALQPLPGLFEALRQDGSPPLYYLLLKGWSAVVGEGTVAVRLPSALLTVVALVLARALGRRVAGVAGGRATVVVLAALPWTMRFGSETRMYLLVVVLVLAGALALDSARRSARAVPLLALCAGALLLTHYWALFLLAAVGLVHLPGLLRREGPAVRVALGLAGGAVLFLPWLPSFLFQAARTGAPWADPVTLLDLLTAPQLWAARPQVPRVVLAVLLTLLAVRGARRRLPRTGAVVGLTLLLAFVATAVGGGAWTARYTAVVVPLVALLAGVGALGLRRSVWALSALVVLGVATGVPAAGSSRTAVGEVADAVRAAGATGDLVVVCPDQLGPPLVRLLPGVDAVSYPALTAVQRVDWVDYAERHAAARPAEVARAVNDRAGGRPVTLLRQSGYRTLEGQCEALAAALAGLRGAPDVLWTRKSARLERFGG
jgi:mannosyltransferase